MHIQDYMTSGEHRTSGTGRLAVGQRKDGSTFRMELFVGETKSEGRLLFTGLVRDLTERHKTEARLQELLTELSHVSRLAALGEMASTLAHEVNQPLTVVTNYLRGARRLLDNEPNEQSAILRDALNKAAEHTLRAGEIVRHLREFVARGSTERRVEDINTLIDEASTLAFMGAANKGVKVRIELEPSETLVVVDKIQIQQVLLNLIRNAIEAMEDSPRRELTVSSASFEGNMAAVRVADTGPGISPEVAPELFRAFRTTKAHGMGIGLSICRTIIESHGGRIFVQPRPEGGTIFCFTLETVTRDQVDECEA